jgi:putative phage-type endonuclease
VIGKELMIDQNTPEWFEARRYRITASEISGVLRNPKRAARDYIRKALGRPATFPGNAATAYGHEAEPVAATWFADKYDMMLQRVGFVVDHHDDRLGCSPDRIAIEDGNEVLLEIKCPYTAGIPEDVQPDHVQQVQFQMGVTGVHKAFVLYWTPEAARVFVMHFDKDWWHSALDQLARFFGELPPRELWEAWLDGAEGQEDTRSDEQWQEAARVWIRAKQAADAAAEAEEEARAALLALSPEAPAQGAGVRLTWVERQGAVNWKKLQADFMIPASAVDRCRGKPSRYARLEVADDQRDDRKD